MRQGTGHRFATEPSSITADTKIPHARGLRLGNGTNLYDGISQPERCQVRSPISAGSVGAQWIPLPGRRRGRSLLPWAAKNQTMALAGSAIPENFFLSVTYLTPVVRFLNDAGERGRNRPSI